MQRRIAYITDIHLDEQFVNDEGADALRNWNTILEDIEKRKIEEVIFGGDIGSKASNALFFSTLDKFKLSLTLGNHDFFEEVTKHFHKGVNDANQELFYTEEDDYYKFIFLDSSPGTISQRQLEWLPEELKSTKRILLFIHHPVLPVHSEMDKVHHLKDRDKLKNLLLESGKNITLFCGHYHFEDHSTLENITQLITPASSVQVEKIVGKIKLNPNKFGYRIIELEADKLSTELIIFDKE